MRDVDPLVLNSSDKAVAEYANTITSGKKYIDKDYEAEI